MTKGRKALYTMLKPLLSIPLSVVEIMTIFALILTLFRFKIKPYLLPLLGISILMSIASYVIRDTPLLESFKPVLMYILFFITVKFLFELRFLQTLIVTIVGYIGYSLLQTVLVFGSVSLGAVSLTEVSQMGPSGYSIQAASIVVTVGIVAILQRKRLGFSFMSSRRIKLEIGFLHILFVIGLLVSAVMLFTMLRVDNVVIALFALAADFYLLLRFSIMKEVED